MRKPSKRDVPTSYRKLKQARARRHLLNFIRYTMPEYLSGWFAQELCTSLEVFLDKVVRGESPRLIVMAPPRHGKSQIVSRHFPAFALGKYPDMSFIATSYASDLASSMNRDVQRVIDSDEYYELFPGTRLWGKNIRTVADGSYLRNSDIFEIVNHKGVYKSAGVGAGVTGRGGQVLLIDDPIKDDEEAHSEVVREKIWNWYTSTLYSRQAPGAGILLIMCMTGDMPVLMADGAETPLRDIKVGDAVATYENGAITTSTVKNWKNQGSDLTYGITTISGKLVKANERHPFLVCRNGELEWVRLRDLEVGDSLVRAASAKELGKASSAPSMGAKSQSVARASALRTTAKSDMRQGCIEKQLPKKIGQDACAIATGSNQRSSTLSLPSSMESALCAESHPQEATAEHTGQTSSALITTTYLERSGDSCATIATSPLATEKQKRSFSQPLSTYEITTDEIVEIAPLGYEDVYDIQVERTENFIANGLVSHNTRWHEDDLAGRLLANAKKNGEQWDVLCFPAVAEHDEFSVHDGRLLRKEGEPLHPERYTLDMLNKIKIGTQDEAGVGSRVWNSLYQQRPSAAEGNLFNCKWWKFLRPLKPLEDMGASERKSYFRELGILRIIQRWDTALGEKKQNDWTACCTLGIARNRYYVIDVWKGRIQFPEVKKTVQLQFDRWHPSRVYIEGGGSASGKATVQAMKRDSRVPLFEINTSTDKVLRADTVSPTCESGFVTIIEGGEWQMSFIDQCTKFPNAAHDDDVDAFIGAMEIAIHKGAGMHISEDFLTAIGA